VNSAAINPPWGEGELPAGKRLSISKWVEKALWILSYYSFRALKALLLLSWYINPYL
jgi:hypothetical protein